MWNVRDERNPLHGAASALLEPLERDTPRRHRRDWGEVIEASGLYSSVEKASFDHEQLVDEDGFVERFTSISFVAAAPADARAELAAKLRELVRDEERPIRLPYVTDVYIAFAS